MHELKNVEYNVSLQIGKECEAQSSIKQTMKSFIFMHVFQKRQFTLSQFFFLCVHRHKHMTLDGALEGQHRRDTGCDLHMQSKLPSGP